MPVAPSPTTTIDEIDFTRFREDPLALAALFWPDVYFYRQQRDVIESVARNKETFVPAGNMMGKDFVSGFIVLWFFLVHGEVRVVTTSAKDDHLRVLWDEIKRFIATSKYPLDARKGGPLVCNHHDIRKIVNGEKCPLSYILGMVASDDKMAAMQGHHAEFTLFVADECSSVPDEYYQMASTWAKRLLFIGNTWPCENFWKRGIEGGEITNENRPGFLRRIIRIPADESPNILLALYERNAGIEPTGEVLVKGVKDWNTYCDNLKLWDDHQQTVSLHARFYKGADVMLFPEGWLRLASQRAELLQVRKGKRRARSIGIDTASGGDDTAWCVCDHEGILELIAKKTADTSEIVGETIALGRKWNVPACNWVFDYGGGGNVHADNLRKKGYAVRAVNFGDKVTTPPQYGRVQTEDRMETHEEKGIYFNLRAQMYGQLSDLLNPTVDDTLFAIPTNTPAMIELHRQLALMPKRYDDEGKLKMLPKAKKSPTDKSVTLTQILGRSPDHADAAVLAVHGMLNPEDDYVAGAF